MSEKSKGRPKGGKRLKKLRDETLAMLGGSIPLPLVTDLEFLKSKAIFNSKSMNPRLGDRLVALHFATVHAEEERAEFKAMKQSKAKSDKKKECNSAWEHVGRLQNEMDLVFRVALAQRDHGFFEQVAHGLKALEKLRDKPEKLARLWVAEAWYFLAKRGKKNKQGLPTAAAVSEAANHTLSGRNLLITPNTAAQLMKALGLPYLSQRMKK